MQREVFDSLWLPAIWLTVNAPSTEAAGMKMHWYTEILS